MNKLIESSTIKSAKHNYNILIKDGIENKLAYNICLNLALGNLNNASKKRINELLKNNLFGEKNNKI